MNSTGYEPAKSAASARVEATETRRRVGELLARQRLTDQPSTRIASRRIGPTLYSTVPSPNRLPITRSAPASSAGLERGDLARIVLAVGVELERRGRSRRGPAYRKPGLQRAADAEVERQLDHVHAGARRERGGLVDGAVGDDDHVEVGADLAELGERAGQRRFLVERRNHDERVLRCDRPASRRSGSGVSAHCRRDRSLLSTRRDSSHRSGYPLAPETLRFRRPHIAFIVVACVFGVAFALTLPPLAGADEGVHFLRAWHVSNGHVFAESGHRAGDPAPTSARMFRRDSSAGSARCSSTGS